MTELKIMTEAHVSQVAEIEKLCFSDPWSENSVASELKNPLSYWLVALDGDTVAGYIGSQSVLDTADIMNVAVHPDYRRQGIGRQLVTALAQALVEKGIKYLMLEVRQSNAPAIALYE
jgi:ribosomal-protein-alanine N-acetyltransferase